MAEVVVPAAQRLVRFAVHQLEQLDVNSTSRQPAAAQFDLPLLPPRPGCVRDAPRMDRTGFDEPLPAGGGPDQRRNGGLVAGTEAESPAMVQALSKAWNSQLSAQRA